MGCEELFCSRAKFMLPSMYVIAWHTAILFSILYSNDGCSASGIGYLHAYSDICISEFCFLSDVSFDVKDTALMVCAYFSDLDVNYC